MTRTEARQQDFSGKQVLTRPADETWQNPERGQPIAPLLLTRREAARLLRISERTLFDLTKAGQIPAVRIGKQAKRYRRTDLEQFVQSARPFLTEGRD